MPKPYDDAMKKLVGGNPQDFLSWVLQEAIYTQRLPYELHPERIYADGPIEAVLDGERILAHFEFQSSYDLRIGERLLEYNVLASRQYDYLTVYSYVIYLKDCGNVCNLRLFVYHEEAKRLSVFITISSNYIR